MGGCSCGGSMLLYSSKNEKISIKKKGKKKMIKKLTGAPSWWIYMGGCGCGMLSQSSWNRNISNMKKERIKNFTRAPANVLWWICDRGGSMLDVVSW